MMKRKPTLMRILPRYLLQHAVISTLMVLAVLLAISAFVNILAQSDNVGDGRYQWWDAWGYVLLSLPGTAYDVFPIAVLLGGLFGYGQLAKQSELVAMVAGGVAQKDLVRMAALSGVVLAMMSFALGEWVAAPAGQWAKQHRALAKDQRLQLAGEQSGWMREGGRIMHFANLQSTENIQDIIIFDLDVDRWRLQSMAQAQSAKLEAASVNDGQPSLDVDTKPSASEGWLLQNVRSTQLVEAGVRHEFESERADSTQLDSDILSLAVVEPRYLNLFGLHRYASYLKANDQQALPVEVAFWLRWMQSLIIVLMAILALPFVFANVRDSGLGQRMMLGVVMGAGYFLLQKTLVNLGLALELAMLPAWLIALGPVVVLAGVVWFFLWRMRFA